MRYRPDRTLRRLQGGRILLGGSPGRLMRLSEAGAELVSSLVAGKEVRSTRGVDALVDRLVDAGMVHPQPGAGDGPYGVGDLTVVVPVRDRPDGLERLLASLHLDPGGSRARVVVVDDGSTVPVRIDGVTVLRRDRPGGPAAARNAGAAQVDTPLVAFVDSDCTVEPGWLDPLLGHFADPAVVAVAPRVRAAEQPASLLSRVEAHDSPLDLGDEPGRIAAGTRISYVPSAALVVRTDALRDVGGFDEHLRVGEDVDLVWRLGAGGHRLRYEPRSTVRHEVRPGLAAWLRQRFDYGTSAAALDERHPHAVAPVAASGWSYGVWGLVALGHPFVAATLAAGTAVAMARRVPDLPPSEVVRLVGGGHLGAGRQLARATVRVWWPAALAASLVSRRARRLAVLAAAVVGAEAWADGREGTSSAVERIGLRFADDLAYGAGVWTGCWRHRSPRALTPRSGSPPETSVVTVAVRR